MMSDDHEEEDAELRRHALDLRLEHLQDSSKRLRESLSELFFLQNNGNFTDFLAWRQSRTIQLVEFLRDNFDGIVDDCEFRSLVAEGEARNDYSDERDTVHTGFYDGNENNRDCNSTGGDHSSTGGKQQPDLLLPGFVEDASSSTPSDLSTTAAKRPADRRLSSSPQVKRRCDSPLHVDVPSPSGVSMSGPLTAESDIAQSLASPTTEDGIAERARQESHVLSRIATLRRDGMWSLRRLPKCAEPARSKTHWDYVLEEMTWMAADFRQERKWKRMAAKKISQAISKTRREQELELERVAVEHERDMRRIAATNARMVRQFWAQVSKVIDYKTKSLLEEKKKMAIDEHLSFIVDETQKYSEWVQEELQVGSVAAPAEESHSGSGEDSSDNESTIEQQEKGEDATMVKEEVSALEGEAGMELDDVLASLPSEYLAALQDGYVVAGGEVDSSDGSASDDDLSDEEDNSASNDVEDEQPECSAGVDINFSKLSASDSQERQDELTHIAETVEKFQPTGCTLETTRVITPVPHLLRHELREYQHVGLDWLVALHERRLNGILADEMGLGKTIQTIALLAHLACEKSCWGPHLIVVPTSVILNWEMELKKWCPGFKILTYYGSKNERAEKRKGWNQQNAFHVCITSYKLVTQDARVFRCKRWKYLVLDEAQNIKNFKSQRWQVMQNFNSEHRLLLTGTPLQNNLLELWSLMHFLMPSLFTSHRDFGHWFGTPLRDIVEGTAEFNQSIVQRLHKVLRPFLLRRLKSQVEKQLPRKYEHVVQCRLAKRQRYLYEDFMLRSSTKCELSSGNMMSVLNVLMQLRKVCNHPNLFEPRPTVSPFVAHPVNPKLPRALSQSLINIWSDCVMPHRLCEAEALSRPGLRTFKDLQLSRESVGESESRIAKPKLPVSTGFRFHSLAVSFVIPSTVAQHVDFDRPIMLHIDTVAGQQIVPVMLSQPLLQGYPVSIKNSAVSAIPEGHVPVLQLVASSVINQPPSVKLMGFVPLHPIYQGQSTHLSVIMTRDGLTITTQAPPRPLAKHKAGFVVSRTLLRTVPSQQNERASTSEQQRSGPCTVVHSQRSRFQDDTSAQLLEQKTIRDRQFLLESVSSREKQFRKDRINRLIRFSSLSCAVKSLYGPWLKKELTFDMRPQLPRISQLTPLMMPVQARFRRNMTLVKKVCIYVPAASTYRFCPNTYRGVPGAALSHLSDRTRLLHPISVAQSLTFPEARLIEYDCGKLQTMATLLRRLQQEGHRCLVFTQMSRMLDILEAFMSYHGYRYLRLDGATQIEQRQALMERFNMDSRIFAFILSTRSGGIGVNLTGADTVIFYDSDWNPTMDAQAQDRCHRIGQTRDVHIYRLISERTIEENILKKARQKKLLGDIAIEDGSFTAEFFTKPSSIRDLVHEIAPEATAVDVDVKDVEKVMTSIEDASDVAAAKAVQAEVQAESLEFDETAAAGSRLAVTDHMADILETLKPIERYAVKYLDSVMEPELENELRQAEESLRSQKLQWQRRHAEVLEEQQRATEQAMSEQIGLTFSAEDGYENKMFCPANPSLQMPTWAPPSPPHSDSEPDIYIDHCLSSLYEVSASMEEVELPLPWFDYDMQPYSINTPAPVLDSNIATHDAQPLSVVQSTADDIVIEEKPKKRKISQAGSAASSEQIESPSLSLFDTPAAQQQRVEGSLASTYQDLEVPIVDHMMGMQLNVFEEALLLQVYKNLQSVHMDSSHLQPRHPAFSPNWPLIAQYFNRFSFVYRSPALLRHHLLRIIAPREEGRLSETAQRKLKRADLNAQEIALLKSSKKPKTMDVFRSKGRGVVLDDMRAVSSKLVQSEASRSLVRFQDQRYECATNRFQTSARQQATIMNNYKVNIESPITDPMRILALREERAKMKQEALQQQQQQQQQQQPQQQAQLKLQSTQRIAGQGFVQQPPHCLTFSPTVPTSSVPLLQSPYHGSVSLVQARMTPGGVNMPHSQQATQMSFGSPPRPTGLTHIPQPHRQKLALRFSPSTTLPAPPQNPIQQLARIAQPQNASGQYQYNVNPQLPTPRPTGTTQVVVSMHSVSARPPHTSQP